jgi:hypothetical protein
MNQILVRPLITIALVVEISLSGCAQKQTLPSAVVIEATSTQRAIKNYVDRRLWVRLRKDGTLEWEESAQGKQNELHSTRISPSQLATVEQDIRSIDWSKVQGRMGPYNAYIDTSYELQIRVATSGVEREFALLNPWPGIVEKPLPADLKELLCELDVLHARASGEGIHQICAGTSNAAE